MALPEGAYDRLVTHALRTAIGSLPPHLKAVTEALGADDAVEYLVREVAHRTRSLLRGAIAETGEASVLASANTLLAALRPGDPAEAQLLTGVVSAVVAPPRTPVLPLSQSALVTNEQGLNYHAVLRSELLSADRVDLVCPFIGNQGLNLILDLLQNLGPKLRVVTTTYLGGTHVQALVRLARAGAQIRIVYERPEQKTALHAKAWIFHRDSGYTTATIGSSNLSPRALVDGLEWNVRIGAQDVPQVLQELIVTFERVWADPLYERFDPERDTERVGRELAAQRGGEEAPVTFFADLTPYPHQNEALDALRYARLSGRHRNLVVAATGTGKTLLAAFDYARIARERGGRPSLLFVAHREDILRQSLGAFRAVMRDSDFGELNVGSHRAQAWKHVFASVQSLAARDLAQFDPERFWVVIVDEFHHAEAPTYTRLLEHFQPRELLGLTATPERADGQRGVIEQLWPPTFELRLWHALERRLLCPFHYFGIDDGTDLTGLRWTNGKYDESDLERELVQRGEARAQLVLRELHEKADPTNLRAVAFCASIGHADYMAGQFRRAGLDARALHSRLSDDTRSQIVRDFRTGKLPIVCTVDLFNEGVDIPEINVVLFLRPTESATVFVQQLGRGLRNHPEKGALTVLDFVGQQNRKFRMDLRFRAMTGASRTQLDAAVKAGFPKLPPGCDIRLDKVTTERVLRNLREAIPSNLPELAAELRRLSLYHPNPTVGAFLKETGLEPRDLYRGTRSFTQVRHAAELLREPLSERHHRIGAVVHADDRRRLSEYRKVVQGAPHAPTFDRMLAFPLTGAMDLASLESVLRDELLGLFDHLLETATALPAIAEDLPFALHARYSRDEIVAPFRDNPASMRQGTFYAEKFGLDIHLVTLRKSERHFSPTTRYQDYFEAPDRLHWESQSTTTQASATGQRLIRGEGRHLFFVREERDEDGFTSPFVCVGFARSISHEGERPIRLRWKLAHAVPDHTYVRFEHAAG